MGAGHKRCGQRKEDLSESLGSWLGDEAQVPSIGMGVVDRGGADTSRV